MAQFQKEELFGPTKAGAAGSDREVAAKSAPEVAAATQNLVKADPRSPLLLDLAEWTREHKRLALVGAFGIGVFLGVLTRR